MKDTYVIVKVSPILNSKYSGNFVRVHVCKVINDKFVYAKEEHFNIGTINAGVVKVFSPFFKRDSVRTTNKKRYLDTDHIVKNSMFEMEYIFDKKGVMQPKSAAFKGKMRKGYMMVTGEPLF